MTVFEKVSVFCLLPFFNPAAVSENRIFGCFIADDSLIILANAGVGWNGLGWGNLNYYL